MYAKAIEIILIGYVVTLQRKATADRTVGALPERLLNREWSFDSQTYDVIAGRIFADWSVRI